ncbi:MAG: N-acetylmuramic acid 6-phosphate etherase [Anaerolineae bacterium]|nr:N-acetylmuramic acid 6-phosphate etherase [Anaerolineae bacterium]
MTTDPITEPLDSRLTEQQNPATARIDSLPTLDMLRLINDEDQKVALAVRETLPAIAEAVDGIAARLAAGGRLLYLGAGTSGRLGVLDAVECAPTFSAPPELVQGLIAGGAPALTRSVEGAEDDTAAARADLERVKLTAADAVVGIAASGSTPYVAAGLKYAAEVGALTVGVTCNAPAPVLDAAQIKIAALVGPEVITGSTRLKAGTAQKLILNMLSTGTMIKLGKVYGNLMVDVQITNQKLAGRAARIVRQIAGVDEARAVDLLRQAGGAVKVAVVMARRGVDAETARALLRASAGRLRDVIGD